jgi:hypothetical protein
MLADVVKNVGMGLLAEPPSAETLSFLKKHRVPPGIIQSLMACSVSSFMRVGRLTLYPFSALPKENARSNDPALRNGFLVIGSGLNGDPIAVELANAQLAFLAHEVLWGFDPDCTDFEECVARSTLDIDTFWARALVDDDFPVDFYSAGGG